MTDTDSGQVSTDAAEVYDEFFVPALFGQWTEVVLDEAGVSEGDRVLDVGCGTGVLALAAARRVGQADRVVGIDPNEGMLAVAARSPEQVEWRAGIAEKLPFEDGSFDRVVSQFAAMFFTDRRQAIREMDRVLAPGGTLTIATWAPLGDTPGYMKMAELLTRLFGDEVAAGLRAPFVLGDPGEVGDLLAEVSSDVTVRRRDGVARFASIEDWVHTDVRGWTLADMIDDDQYATLLREAQSELASFVDESGRVAFAAPAIVATARKPRG